MKKSHFRLPGMIINDMKKQCLSPAFYIGIFGAVILMTLDTYEVFVNTESVRYTLLEMLVRGKEWIMQNSSFCWEEFVLQQPGRQFIDYVTVLASLPFLIQFCMERKSGSTRLNIVRTGRWRYYFSKIISGMFSGGILVGSGYGIFLLLTWFRIPKAEEVGRDISFILPEGVLAGQFLSFAAFCLFGMFLYGMIAAAPGILFSSFTTDIYVCLTIPFLLKWVNEIFRSYLYTYLYIDHEKIEGKWLQCLSWWKENGGMEQIVYEIQGKKIWQAGVILIGFFLVTATVFCLRMNGRKDYGE